MDDEDLMLETEDTSRIKAIDSAQHPVPPEDLADFDAVVEFLRTLQNSKTCENNYKREQVQQAYQRYYLCPRPFFWIDRKNYFQVTCWRDGSLMFDRCNIDQVKSYLQDQVASSYQFAVGFTGMLTAIPAAIYCAASAIDGGCSYAGKKMYRAYQR